MKTVHAVFEAGVFRPTKPVELPEHSEVEFEPRLVNHAVGKLDLSNVYAILSRSYETGIRDLASRHDEHQP